MNNFANLCSTVVLAFAAVLVATNWATFFANARTRKRGDGSERSSITFIPQLAAGFAAWLSNLSGAPWLPAWAFWAVGLMDIALINLVFGLFRKRPR